MNIYPKTCKDFIGIDYLMPYVNRNNGIELQFFDENGKTSPFDIETPVKKLVAKIPSIKEVTIHPPLAEYELETILMKDPKILTDQLLTLVELSKKYNIKLNIVYHTLQNLDKHKATTVKKLKKILELLEGTDVRILIENIFMFFEKKCTPYELAEYIDHPNLKVCFDLCHIQCRANIYKMDYKEMAKTYLDKELCKKYTYQVHFANALNGDGYIDKKTHGRKHVNVESLKDDIDFLKEYNLTDCNYVIEVSEEEYSLRNEQIDEIKMLIEVVDEK